MSEFTARFASAEEIADWDRHVTANPGGGNMLQSASFADVKSRHGWKPLFLVIEGSGQASYNLALEKSVPLLGRLWYLIKGPDAAEPAQVPAAVDAVVRLAEKDRLNVFAVKIEPDIVDSQDVRELFLSAGFVKTFDIQPNDHTALLDVSPEPNALLRTLHSRGRNAVRRAIREGVQVERVEPTEENFRIMHNLMNQVQDRTTVQLRSFDYYRRFWRNFVDAGQGRLYFVREDGEPSVGAFVVNYGRKGTYKDGGSKPKRSQYGDSHLLQWTAINDLKDEFGITEYDFCGTPPSHRLKDTTHGHYGLGLFKTSFTKTVTDFVGCWDLPVKPLSYRIWTLIGERVARQAYWRRHRQPFY